MKHVWCPNWSREAFWSDECHSSWSGNASHLLPRKLSYCKVLGQLESIKLLPIREVEPGLPPPDRWRYCPRKAALEAGVSSGWAEPSSQDYWRGLGGWSCDPSSLALAFKMRQTSVLRASQDPPLAPVLLVISVTFSVRCSLLGRGRNML